MPAPRKSSASVSTAAALRRDVLRLATDGAFLGSEDELLERYRISRPTLRQAARILEHEQLIDVRRGVGGGFYTRLPTSEAVSRVASVFLQINGTQVSDLLRAVTAIAPSLAEMACEAPIAERVAFRQWVSEQQPGIESMRRREFVAYIAEHGRRLAALAACPPLQLFQNVLMELTLAESRVNVFEDRRRMQVVGSYQQRLADAIAKGDRAEAGRLARHNEARTAGWLDSADAR